MDPIGNSSSASQSGESQRQVPAGQVAWSTSPFITPDPSAQAAVTSPRYAPSTVAQLITLQAVAPTASQSSTPLRSSLSGMHEFVEVLFRDADRSPDHAYEVYMNAGGVANEQEKLPRSEYGPYLKELGRIDKDSRAAGIRSEPQFYPGSSTHSVVNVRHPNDNLRGKLYTNFFRAFSAAGDGQASSEGYEAKVALRITPTYVPAVWRYVSTQLLPEMPGELSDAKVVGPSGANRRTESVDIYTRHPQAHERVCARLREVFGDSVFRSGAPYMLEEIAPGIAWAEERASDGSMSTGDIATSAALLALRYIQEMTAGSNVTADEALRLLKSEALPRALAEHGRNPDAPHRVLQ